MMIDLEGKVIQANAEAIRSLRADRDGWTAVYDPKSNPRFCEA